MAVRNQLQPSCARSIFRAIVLLSLFILNTLQFSATAFAATFSLQSGTGAVGQPVSLPLSFTGSVGTNTSAVEFGITYSASQFSSVAATVGTAGTAAGKSVSCLTISGGLRCVVYGLNTTTLGDGAVATVIATPLTAGTTAPLTLNAAGSTNGGLPTTFAIQSAAVTTPSAPPPPTGVCADVKVLCVDDTPGSTQEFSTIQAAADAAGSGSQILVHPGTYAGFRITRSGTTLAPIVFKANGAVTIAAASGDAITISNASFVTVDGFVITQPAGRCLTATAASPSAPIKGLKIANLSCSGAKNGGIKLISVLNSVVEGNTISGVSNSHGISIENGGSDKIVMRRNTIRDLTGSGISAIHFNGNSAAGADGIITSATLENNVMYNVPGDAITFDGVQSSVVQNNIAYNFTGSALRALRSAGAAGPKAIQVINNTFHGPATSSWIIRLSQEAGAHTIFNNILLTDSTTAGSISVSSTSNLKSNYNVVISRFSVDDGKTLLYLTDWRGRGYDAKSFTAAPWQIFAKTGSDYHLASTSFAIDKGTAMLGTASAPVVDCENGARPQRTTYDIGAYEVGGSGLPVKPVLSLTAPASGATVSGTSVAVSASVSDSSFTAVQFYLDGVALGAEDAAAPFSIVWNTSGTANGAHVLHAIARNTSGATITSASVNVTVSNVATPVITSLTVVSSANPAPSGQAVTFTASINPTAATGAVQFRDGSVVLGTVNLSSGRAVLSTSALAAGTHSIQASYAGSAGYAASSSNALSQVIENASGSCADPRTLCVDDQAGPTQEYSTIQQAATAALAGDTVLVHPGTYTGFRVTTSGVSNAPLTFKINGAAGSVVINTASSSGDGIYLGNVSNVVISGFSIQNVSGACIAARGAQPTSPMTNLTISDNTCLNAKGLAGIYVSQVSNSKITGNTISGLTTSRTHGIYLANAGSDNTVLRGNTIYNITGSDAAGIHMNGDLSVGRDGIISGALLDGNTIYDVNFNAVSMDGVQNSTLSNNVIYRVARAGVRAFCIDGAQGPKGLRFVNNTIHSTGGWAIKATEDLGGHQAFNNILLTDSTSAGSICIGSTTGFNSANNAAVNRFSRDGDSSVISMATWQNSGFESNSFVTTAATVTTSPTTGDYRLKTGSPAVDKGLPALNGVTAPAVDRLGTSRPRGSAHDIGAYEQ